MTRDLRELAILLCVLVAACSSTDGAGQDEDGAEPLATCVPGVWTFCFGCETCGEPDDATYSSECAAPDCQTCHVRIFREDGSRASGNFRLGGGHFSLILVAPDMPEEACAFALGEGGSWSVTEDGRLDLGSGVVVDAVCTRDSLDASERAPDGLALALLGAWENAGCIKVPYDA